MSVEPGTDIGHGHRISYYTWGEGEGHAGIIDSHLTPEGERCSGGSVLFDIPQNADLPATDRWTVVSEDPLTLSPSLLCRICGEHGWIRDGAWVPA